MKSILNNPFSLTDDARYFTWRENKLTNYPNTIENLIVSINNPYQLTTSEKKAILEQCHKTNFAIYQIPSNVTVDKSALHSLAKQFGLGRLDHNLCADEDGIAALQVVTEGQSQDYIPYTNRPINWHTDGYYNTSEQQVQALLMHCVQPAENGGDNELLDHEMAYIQLRDKNPDYIMALMVADVMTIPANVQEGIELRPTQTGPVFSVHPQSGTLHMRYTARTRNIIWKKNDTVTAALAYLTGLFKSHSPYVFRHRLESNQGIICNNLLHNRNGFTDSSDPNKKRLLYRMRFYDRVGGSN